MEPIQGTPTGCKNCGAFTLDFKFDVDLRNVVHMTIGDEWVALEPIPITVKCLSCGWQRPALGREVTIDTVKMVVTMCRIAKEDLDA